MQGLQESCQFSSFSFASYDAEVDAGTSDRVVTRLASESPWVRIDWDWPTVPKVARDVARTGKRKTGLGL